MEKIIDRVKSILLSPKDALTAVKSEELSIADFMKEYVAIIAAIPPIAQFIGFAMVGHPVFGRRSFIASLFFAVVSYVLTLVSVLVFGKVVNALASNFNSTKDDMNAFKLAVYAFTPGLVVGIANIVPSLSVLAMLGALYGIYILYIGLPILMATPEDKNVAYTIVSLICGLILMVVIAWIATAIAFGGAVSAGYF